MMPQSGYAHLSQRPALSALVFQQPCKTVRREDAVELMQPNKDEHTP